jgi:hypothetical protein
MEDQGLLFIWLPPFDLSGMGNPMKSLCSRQHSSQGQCGAPDSSLHDMAVLLVEEGILYGGENFGYLTFPDCK